MKKKYIVIILFIVGAVLVCLPLVLAVIETANKDIIGGADIYTFNYVFFRENRGIHSILTICGMIFIIVSVVMRSQRRKK